MNLPKVKKILKWIGIILLALIVILFLLMNFAMPFKDSDKKLAEYLNRADITLSIQHLAVDNYNIRVVNTHKKGVAPDTNIIFIHGAPGSLSDFKAFLKDNSLLDKYNLIAIDRPGYGASNSGQAEPGIAKQAQLLLKVIDQLNLQNLILVGHSYGGPIAAKMATLAPQKVKGLLLLAPVNEPISEPRYKISWLAIYPPIKWLIPGAVYTSAVEKIAHPGEIEKLIPFWKQIKCKTIHIHGDKDFLAPPSNMDFTKKLIPKEHYELIRLPNENHFLPWTQHSRITDVLITKF